MKEDLSNFLKIAYQHGKVRDLKEAFEEYPVEEEWHKGKIEKLKYKSNKLLKRDKTNHLHKDSIVKTDIVYKISDEQIMFKIGKVDNEKIEEYKKSFYDCLEKEN